MKKILTSVVAAAALLFGLASCSGDLHDKEVQKQESITIAGASWYYFDLTVTGTNENAGNMILNGDASQSTDTPMPAFTADGGVFYFTADKTKSANPADPDETKYELLTSYQTDNPAYTVVPGVVRFYFYTNETSCKFYCWGNDDAFTKSAAWPGDAMQQVGGPSLKEFNVSIKVSIDASFIESTDGAGKKVSSFYVTGSPFSWSYPDPYAGHWGGPWEGTRDAQFVEPGKTFEYSYKVTALEMPTETDELQLLVFDEDTDGATAEFTDDGKTAPHMIQTKNFKLKLTSGKAELNLIVTKSGDDWVVTPKQVNLVAFVVVGLDSTVYAKDDVMVFGGSKLGWPADWNNPDDAHKGVVKEVSGKNIVYWAVGNGEIITSEDVGGFCMVKLGSSGADWTTKIAARYKQEGDGDANANNTYVNKDVVVVADVSGLSANADVEWNMLPTDDNDVSAYMTALGL